MRTPREYYLKKPIMYTYELNACPQCGEPLKIGYTTGAKTVHTMTGAQTVAQRPQYCPNLHCARHRVICQSAQWQQIAPHYCTYGCDVIARVGWLRQTRYERFGAIHDSLRSRLRISESEVHHLHHERYLPLWACHERQYLEQLRAVSEQVGLIQGLDGLAPGGGEPQLWAVRELQTELTLRSGWLSGQDQTTFVNFLRPIADLGLRVVAVMSDKQRGLEPAVPIVFPHGKHGFCQMHYLKNAASPVAHEDEASKVGLRKRVQDDVGDLIRREKVERSGVLTVTGLVPSPVEEPREENTQATQAPPDPIVQEHEVTVQDLLRRVRYLLMLKGRPTFRLADIEKFERLAEVNTCLHTLIRHRTDSCLLELRQGLHTARLSVHSDCTELRQAAGWLEHIPDLLDHEEKPNRSGKEMQQELFAYLNDIQQENQHSPRPREFYRKIRQISFNYAPGLFHCYDEPGLPRTNNYRESEFRNLNQRLLFTTGQKGLVERIIQREGAWELISRSASLRDTASALSQIDPDDFSQERQRIRNHCSRFRLHTRSARQSQGRLKQLEERWKALPPIDSTQQLLRYCVKNLGCPKWLFLAQRHTRTFRENSTE